MRLRFRQGLLITGATWAMALGASAQPVNLGYALALHPGPNTTTFFYPTHAAEAPTRQGPFQN